MRSSELVEAWTASERAWEGEAQAHREAVAHIRGRRQALAAAQTEATQALAAVYVPSLDPKVLAKAEKQTGYRGYLRFDPQRAREREEARLRHEIAAVEAHPDFVEREQRIGPFGSLTRRLQECKDQASHWEETCRPFDAIPDLQELIATGYDTPDFQVRWWDARYWRLWAAGDAACEALGLADFGDDVLPAWRKVHEPREAWRRWLAEAVAAVEAVHNLVKRRDEMVWRLNNLDQIYLDECRAALAKHLETADSALLESWAEGDRARVMGIRQLAGCRAKVAYADEIAAGLEAAASDFEARRAKSKLKAMKYARPKYAYTDHPASLSVQGVADKTDRVRAQRAKVLDSFQKMERYDDYGRFDLGRNDPALWWYEMTGRRPSVAMGPSRDWYNRQLHLVVIREDDAGVDAAAAVADAMADRAHDGLGDLS
jgi:hypothetical protein